MIPANQNSTGDADVIPYPLANYFLLGNFTVNGVVGGFPVGAILTTEEAWNIDTKIDDGLPYQGFFQKPLLRWLGTAGCTRNKCLRQQRN
jgi:hypothetical protein